MLLQEKGTKHGIDIELLTHIAKFISKFGIGFDLVFVPFGKIVETMLKFIVDIFDLNGASSTMTAFFSISTLAASLFLLNFS